MKNIGWFNDLLKKTEDDIFRKTLEVSHHLTQSYKNGMDVYKDFCVEGQIYVYPDDAPDDVCDRFSKIPRHTVIYSAGCDDPEDNIYKDKLDRIHHYDYYYFKNPEDYPADYSPMTETYDKIISKSLIDNIITEDDLSYLTPNSIYTNIEINI